MCTIDNEGMVENLETTDWPTPVLEQMFGSVIVQKFWPREGMRIHCGCI